MNAFGYVVPSEDKGLPVEPCICEGYQVWQQFQNDLLLYVSIRPNAPHYDGPYWRFCPYCGTSLEEVKDDGETD